MGMAQDLSVIVSGEDRARLEAIVSDRNRLLKHTQRARIVLLSAKRLPVLQVADFDPVLRAPPKALNLTVPQSLLGRADEVIE